MSVESALEALRLKPRFMRNIIHWAHIPARAADYVPFPAPLDPRLGVALRERGIEALYRHQALAFSTALAGENVTVVTPTASGKTLCYNLPVLQCLLADPHARALYLFPTKALAQDQLAELRKWTEMLSGKAGEQRRTNADENSRTREQASRSPLVPLPPRPATPLLTCATYDGDTPGAQRAKIRDGARIILSNPDMLHAGILPQHPRWAGFFANLAIVVVDEMHVYRGVFGSHVANVLRRLRRICRFYGKTPQFILASATIANPAELAERLIEAPVTVIGPDQDGSPQSEKHILFYNPPMLDPDLGIRRSSTQEAADLAAHFLAHDVQTIVFARSRLNTELILTQLRENKGIEGTGGTEGTQVLDLQWPAVQRKSSVIRGYRSGYLAEERRAIERGLRTGSVRGVVATNALELGIDIGQLDAAVLAGYPGTVASTRQQIGRAGRRTGPAVGVLVAGPDALDQYVVTHPEWLLGQSPEHARINPDNEIILAGHLACAAAELPIRVGEVFAPEGTEGFSRSVVPREKPAEASGPGQWATTSSTGHPPLIADLLDDLVAAGQLYRSGDRYYWVGDGSPASALSLRSIGPARVIIQATDVAGRPQVIGEIDRPSVLLLLYPGAIYLHEGRSYLVEQLDWGAGIAHVQEVQVDYYTRPIINEKIELLTIRGCYPENTDTHSTSHVAPPTSYIRSAWGDVRVTREATGYKILHRGSNEVLGVNSLDLPAQTLETQACQVAFPEGLISQLRAEGRWFSDPNDYGPNWTAQRNAARARDGFRCQGCGQPEQNGRQHDVHHKVPLRAFVADPLLRPGLTADQAWQAANRLENLVTLCPTCHRRAEATVRIRTGLGGVAALLVGVAPLFLMCDARDLGMAIDPQEQTSGAPTITLYERTPGGIGYAEQLAASMPVLLQAALKTVNGCPCTTGCPGCVGPILEHDYVLDAKALAKALLERAIGISG